MEEREDFTGRYVQAVLELPQDVKVLFEILDDGELSDEHRLTAAGALFALVSPGDLIPDTWGPLGLLDDAVILRLAARQAVETSAEVAERYATRFPGFFADLTGDLEAAREVFAESFSLFEQRLPKLGQIEHKGRRATQALESDEVRSWLFDEVEEAMTDVDFEEADVFGAMRRLDSVVAHLRRRLMHR